MARQNNEMIKVKCSKCEQESEFEIWQCINATEANGLIEKVKDGSMFRHTCPHCQQAINVEYSFLYHQIEDALMIHYCIKDEDAQAVIKTLTEPTEEQKPIIKQMIDKGTIIRIVRKKFELIEKMCIYEAGFDDRVIEILKILVGATFVKENPDKKIDNIFFNIKMKQDAAPEDEGVKILQVYSEGKPIAETVVNEELYQKIFNDYVAAMPPLRADHNIIVNRNWARSVIDLKNAEANPAE